MQPTANRRIPDELWFSVSFALVFIGSIFAIGYIFCRIICSESIGNCQIVKCISYWLLPYGLLIVIFIVFAVSVTRYGRPRKLVAYLENGGWVQE